MMTGQFGRSALFSLWVAMPTLSPLLQLSLGLLTLSLSLPAAKSPKHRFNSILMPQELQIPALGFALCLSQSSVGKGSTNSLPIACFPFSLPFPEGTCMFGSKHFQSQQAPFFLGAQGHFFRRQWLHPEHSSLDKVSQRIAELDGKTSCSLWSASTTIVIQLKRAWCGSMWPIAFLEERPLVQASFLPFLHQHIQGVLPVPFEMWPPKCLIINVQHSGCYISRGVPDAFWTMPKWFCRRRRKEGNRLSSFCHWPANCFHHPASLKLQVSWVGGVGGGEGVHGLDTVGVTEKCRALT